MLASGSLTVGPDTISFESKKLSLTIAASSVTNVAHTRFQNDPANTWIVVEYDEAGSRKAAAFKGPGLGLAETRAIETALLSFTRAAAFARAGSTPPRETPADEMAAGTPPSAGVGAPEARTEFAPYEGLKDQFTIALPVGWLAHDQSADIGKPGPYGVVVFSPVNLGRTEVTDDQKALDELRRVAVGVDSGEIPSLAVDRHKAERGMSCEAINDNARKRAVNVYETSLMGNNGHLFGTTEVKAMPVGGCQGLRVRIRSRDPEGNETHTLVYAVSDGRTTYDFFLRNGKEFFEKNLPIFEQMVATLKITARRGQ